MRKMKKEKNAKEAQKFAKKKRLKDYAKSMVALNHHCLLFEK